MNIPAKKTATGEAVGVVFNGLIDQAAVPGPYGVFGAAKLTVDRASHTDAEGKTIIDEIWQAKADDGSMLEVQLQFARGVPARGKVEAKLHSAGKPEFYRIYKFEQAADVARSTATGIDRVSKFSIKGDGSALCTAVRRLGAAHQHHIGAELFAVDLRSGNVTRQCGRACPNSRKPVPVRARAGGCDPGWAQCVSLAVSPSAHTRN